MKTKRSTIYTINPLITIFLIIHSSAVYDVAFTQKPTNTPVLDTDGNPLQSEAKYYVYPLNHRAGGLALSIRDRHDPCPPTVLQENDETSVGLSLRVFPLDQKQVDISLSSDVNIAFNGASVCVQRTVWRVGGVDGITGRIYVRSDGVVGRPGTETVANWFKIDGSGKGYKIVYSPSVCGTCRVECGDVGVFVENGRRWLGLDGDPLVIVFKKVQN